MKFGYARVSKDDQNLEMQIDAFELHGCDKVYKEKKGALKERPEFEKLLVQLREGDTLMVWRIDRMGRSLRQLVNIMHMLKTKGIKFISITENIDTDTSMGEFLYNFFGCLAQYEHSIIRERTKAGLAAARKKGHFSGRKPGLSKQAQQKAFAALSLSKNKRFSVGDITMQLDISKGSYYRYIDWADKQLKGKKKKN